jgi:hypothetical protein
MVITVTASVFTVQSASARDVDCTAQGRRNEAAGFPVVGRIPVLRLVFNLEQSGIPASFRRGAKPGPRPLQLRR